MTATLDRATEEVRQVREPEDLDDLRAWAQQQNRIAIAVDAKGVMTMATEAGTSWSVDLRSVGLAVEVLDGLATSGAYLWAPDATSAYLAIASRTDVVVDELRCARTAMQSHNPENDDLPGVATGSAVETARLIATIYEESDREERRMILRDVRVDDLWRWPALQGYRVDPEVLSAQRQIVVEAQRRSVERFGVDLTVDYKALKWMEERGVVCTDKGQPTCSNRDLPFAQVPDGMEEDWVAFVEMRQEAHCANAIKSVYRNLAPDGRVHPRINSIGAKTGRMSIVGPPLQAMPYQLRPAFVADEGKTLVGQDLDRVEPCLVAAASGDPGLIAATEGDIYSELAVELWGEEDARSDPDRRAQAKTSLNAIVYGQGAASLGRRLGVTTDEAQAILDGWSAAYPEFEKWKKGIIAKAKKGQAPTTLFGRRTRQPEHPYQAVSYVIQGTAADVFKELTLNVARQLPDEFHLWLPIHDELILQVPDDPSSVGAALEILSSHMQCEVKGVRIGGTPIHVGRAWQKI